MSAFDDLHVAFDGRAPGVQRFGVAWREVLAGDDTPWIGRATAAGAGVPLEATAPGWRIWASGDVFAYRADPDRPLDRFAADLAAGRAEPAALDAHAVLIGWEEARRRVHVWTDRLGTAHVYRGEGARPAIGTMVAAVEDPSRALDWVGITGFCALGFYPADRTWRDGLRIVRPATWMVLDDRGSIVQEVRTWSWNPDPDHRIGIDAAADEFAEVWDRTIRRQIAGRDVVIPLSGGLDSRTVLAAATAGAGARAVRTFTYGYQDSSIELSIARRLGALRSAPPVEQVVDPYLLDRIADVTGSVEGFSSLSQCRQVGASAWLAPLGERIVGGHWGDVWFERAGAPPDAASAPAVIAELAHRKFVKRGSGDLVDALCRPHLDGADPDTVLRDLLVGEAARLPTFDDADMALKALKTDQWSFRWTLAGTRAYHLARPTTLPFYANEVVDLFLRLPADIQAGRAVQTAYLRRHHPDLAAVTWQDSGRSLHDRPWERPLSLARRAGRKALRAARRRPVVERNWEVQYLGGDRPDRLRSLVDRTVDATSIEPAVVAPIVDRFLTTPGPASAYAVDATLTVLCAVTGPSAAPGTTTPSGRPRGRSTGGA